MAANIPTIQNGAVMGQLLASGLAGLAVLVAGVAVVPAPNIVAGAFVAVFRVLDGGTVGGIYVVKTADITPGTGFTIRSLVSSTAGAATVAGSDTSTVAWIIFQ
jgi:hypothetical protein